MIEIKCIFCKIESNYVVIEENGYKGKQCPQCGLIYISPRPSFDEIVDLYAQDNAHKSAESHITADFLKRLYAIHNIKIIRSFVKRGTLLEIGAGAGYFLEEARKKGLEPYGLEFNPIQANHIRNRLNIPCEETSLKTSVFKNKQFDVVYHCDVISHFFDPIAEFKRINRILKDGSFLIFETGNLGEVAPMYFKHFKRFQYPDHLFFFSTDNLMELLKKTGFEFIKIYRYSLLPQMVVMKALSAVKYLIIERVPEFSTKEINHSDEGRIGNRSVANSQSLKPKIISKIIIKHVYQYLKYVMRYKVGRIALKAHRPQTIIIIAKKMLIEP